MSILSKILDTKLEQLAMRLENMMTEKLKEMEAKLKDIKKEMQELKEDFNDSLNQVENIRREQVNEAWQYAVRNEQYSRKNNIRILGVAEEDHENLENKIIKLGTDYDELAVDIKKEEIEIAHRVGSVQNRNYTGNMHTITQW